MLVSLPLLLPETEKNMDDQFDLSCVQNNLRFPRRNIPTNNLSNLSSTNMHQIFCTINKISFLNLNPYSLFVSNKLS